MSETVRPGGTYQTLDEQREKLSPAEERFERARQMVGLFLGPVVLLALYLVPLPLPQDQQALAAVFAFAIIYWLTDPIPIPVTAVLGLAMCVLFEVAPAEEVFGAFSSPTIFLFIGAFIISETTSNTASVGIAVPIIIPIANSAGVEPLIPALAAVFGASYGFMLPVSTPPNAIVYGSGMYPR